MKRIMLQGYLHNANFGDILAACLFYKRCQKNGYKHIDFYQYKDYGIGPFCREQLGYTTRKSLLSCFTSDAFVILSGGSFWNNKQVSYDAKIRFERFVLPSLIYLLMGKPVYVLGVGGGAVDTLWLRKLMVLLLNRAKVVTFRDEHTQKVFTEYGVRNKMTVTADTMLVIKKEMLEPFEEENQLKQAANGRKKLLLHIPDGGRENACVADKVLPALVRFLQEHQEYYLVLSNDNIRKIGTEERKQIERIRTALAQANIDFYDYQYHDCWQMCSLLGEMDCVITSKLHVGVIACALDKCVVAFPVHREKTDNFYRMIGESDRCVNMKKLDAALAYQQILNFHDKPVHISDELRQRAEQNLSVLDEIAK